MSADQRGAFRLKFLSGKNEQYCRLRGHLRRAYGEDDEGWCRGSEVEPRNERFDGVFRKHKIGHKRYRRGDLLRNHGPQSTSKEGGDPDM